MAERDNTEMEYGYGSFSYPGIQNVIRATYSRSHGITPDAVMVEMAPQSLTPGDSDYTPIEPDGWCLFEFTAAVGLPNAAGVRATRKTQILLQGCRPDKARVKKTGSGETWSIPIYDRRWRWAFGSFSGHWNVKVNGFIEERKKRTPKQLAELCLEAMGEIKYDTSALLELEKLKSLPYRGEIFPEVHWDRIPPAQALNELVNSLGYRVCLGWDDRVRICKYGTGELLPLGDLSAGGFESDLPEIPDSYTVVGEITQHELAWELEAVGLDIDGTWKPIDHLSYRPPKRNGKPGKYGWLLSEPPNFGGIEQYQEEMNENKSEKMPEVVRRKEQLQLARDTVYKSYRLKYPIGTEESKQLRDKYNRLGFEIAERLNKGDRRGDSESFDRKYKEYEDAGRELFFEAKPELPGPLQRNKNTGKPEPVKLQELNQVLPCFEQRAELAIDPQTGELKRKPAAVIGRFWDARAERNTLPRELIKRDDYTILPQFGIFRFKEPVFIYGKKEITIDGKKRTQRLILPAELAALIAVPFKTVEGEPARFEYFYETPTEYKTKPARLPDGLQGQPPRVPKGTDTKVLKNNQIELAYKASYEWKTNKTTRREYLELDSVDSNFKTQKLENQALETLDVELKRIRATDSGSGTYAGLKVLNLDGAIQQVAISLDTRGGMVTTIARNTEVNILVPDFDERQRDAALKEMVKAHNEKTDKTEKVKPKND